MQGAVNRLLVSSGWKNKVLALTGEYSDPQTSLSVLITDDKNTNIQLSPFIMDQLQYMGNESK